MVASVAVLSDIHAVLPALDAVLAEPDVRDAERIVLTGDIAAGPQPTQTLDRLLGLGDRVTWVRGNADRELVSLARGAADDVDFPISAWAARQLSADHVDWLARLPYPVTLEVDGFGPVVFCHATNPPATATWRRSSGPSSASGATGTSPARFITRSSSASSATRPSWPGVTAR